MRTLSEGSDLAADFCMEDVLSRLVTDYHDCVTKPFTNKLDRLHIRINTELLEQA